MGTRMDRGGVKICQTCGKAFYIPSLLMYAYKRTRRNEILFFCKYSHMTEYDRSVKKAAAAKTTKKKKPVTKMCRDCAHNIDSGNGYRTCAIGVSLCLYRERPACRRYAEVEPDGRRLGKA